MKSSLKFFPFLLVFYEMAAYLTNDMYLPGLPQLKTDLNINDYWAQMTLTFWFLGAAAVPLFLGPLSDRYGRRMILFAGGIIFLISTAICIFTHNIYLLLLARFLQGTVVCSITTAGYASIHESFDRFQAIKILSVMGSIIILGPAFGPLLGSLVLAAFSWRGIFIILELAAAVLLFALWFVMEESNPQSIPFHWPTLLKNYFAIVTNSQFVLNLLVFCFAYMGMIAWIVLGPFLVIDQFKQSTLAFSIYQCLIFGSMVAATQLIKYYAEKISIEVLIRVGLAIAVITSVIAALLTSLYPNQLLMLVIPMMGFVFGTSLAFSPLNRIAIEACKEPMGARMATLSIFMSLFAVSASVLVSSYFNHTLLWFSLFLLVMSVMAMLSYSLAQYLKPHV